MAEAVAEREAAGWGGWDARVVAAGCEGVLVAATSSSYRGVGSGVGVGVGVGEGASVVASAEGVSLGSGVAVGLGAAALISSSEASP